MVIENFIVYKQKRNNTCGYTTASMIINHLENTDITEDFLYENDPFDEMGITFTKLLEVYKKYLKKYKAEIIYGDRIMMQDIIKNHIKNLEPLHILYLTENLLGNREPVLHYSALIGYDEMQDSITIADPFGESKTIGIDEFFNSVSFRNECLPDIVKQRYPSNMMLHFSLI